MSNPERVIKQTSGILIEELRTPNFPAFVESLVERGIGFPIYPLSALTETEDSEGFPTRPKPIIVFPGAGHGDFPRISDPQEQIPGVFAIYDHSLIYSSHRVLEPRFDRDSYRWNYPPCHYFVDASVIDVVKSFEKNGYPIYISSASYFDFGHGTFGKLTPTSIQEIVGDISKMQ